MIFKYLDENINNPLIDHFYQLTISKKALPFESLIVPIGHTNITYVFSDEYQKAKLKGKEILYKDLILTGQIYGSYQLEIISESVNLGFALKPTALYKILQQDISKFNNQHIALKSVNEKLFHQFNEIFLSTRNNENAFVNSVDEILKTLPLSEDTNLKHIDKAVDYIFEKEGLLKVQDLLKIIPLSQKSLEIQFKKIVGVTPGKYIRQHRFICLMQNYASKKYNLSDLLYMFNYYDISHFSKDFKYFIGQTPKAYFKSDYPLLQEYLKIDNN